MSQAMAQTRRMGMQNEFAQLRKAPRFSPYHYGERATASRVYGFLNQMRFRSISAPRLRKKSLSSEV
jgi:hypothetical protein